MKPAATFRPTMTAALCAASLLALGGCASGSKGPTTTMPPSDAHAQLYDASGADRINRAVRKVLADGLRTPDIWSAGCRKVSTGEMGDAVAAAIGG